LANTEPGRRLYRKGGRVLVEPRSREELVELERAIKAYIREFKLDDVLLGVRGASGLLKPFMVAGISRFAIENCYPPHPNQDNGRPLEWNRLKPLAGLVLTTADLATASARCAILEGIGLSSITGPS
jgi:hypothetical protein